MGSLVHRWYTVCWFLAWLGSVQSRILLGRSPIGHELNPCLAAWRTYQSTPNSLSIRSPPERRSKAAFHNPASPNLAPAVPAVVPDRPCLVLVFCRPSEPYGRRLGTRPPIGSPSGGIRVSAVPPPPGSGHSCPEVGCLEAALLQSYEIAFHSSRIPHIGSPVSLYCAKLNRSQSSRSKRLLRPPGMVTGLTPSPVADRTLPQSFGGR
jgi:hypothetical protein